MKQDLRCWIEEARKRREVLEPTGVHWRVEMGALAELAARQPGAPALLFDEIPGYPSGHRVLVNTLASPTRVARAAGLDPALSTLETVRAWKERYRELEPLPHGTVESGPVFEQCWEGSRIDLFRFPAPQWRSGDGGRYLGTATLCVTRDPESGAINVGTSRVMVHDARHLFYRVSAGKDSRRQLEQARRRQEPFPIAISFGHDPSLLMVAGLNIPFGTCEYDVWGGLSGEALQTVETPRHALPVPSHAELVIEGVVLERTAAEGPFGEWSGYYSRQARQEPLIQVEGVYHRRRPILLAVGTSPPPSELTTFWSIFRSALLWRQLEEAGIPGIAGVWCHPAGGTRLWTVISLDQSRPGQARQALLAAASLPAGAYMGRYLIAVDADTDPTDTEQVIWAVATRSDPEGDADLIRGAWGGPLDPALDSRQGLSSRLLIDACRPWGRSFPAVAGYSAQERERARRLWCQLRDPVPTP